MQAEGWDFLDGLGVACADETAGEAFAYEQVQRLEEVSSRQLRCCFVLHHELNFSPQALTRSDISLKDLKDLLSEVGFHRNAWLPTDIYSNTIKFDAALTSLPFLNRSRLKSRLEVPVSMSILFLIYQLFGVV